MKIVCIEPLAVEKEYLNKLAEPWVRAGHSFLALEKRCDTPKELEEKAGDADIVIEGNQPLPADYIAALKNCKYLSVGFSGIDHVDAKACAEREITVSNSAGYADDSVAELALAMMLDLLRNVKEADSYTRQSKTKDGIVGNELRGKTVGIVGMGACGCRMAEILKAFYCDIIFYTPHPSERALSLGRLVSLEEVFEKSDIVSLHCPLKEETRGLVNEEKIALMKNSAILINTSRGPVVNSEALAEALNNGRIAGAGVDVYENEPPISALHPLLKAKHCICTPHVAFASKESMIKRADIAFGNVSAYLEGTPRNIKL